MELFNPSLDVSVLVRRVLFLFFLTVFVNLCKCRLKANYNPVHITHKQKTPQYSAFRIEKNESVKHNHSIS